jgi:RimJ/RimL family protein N-acetyltransferase
MTPSLFEGERVRLRPPDAENDAAVVSAWTHDLEWLRALSAAPARPLAPGQVKKMFEAIEKQQRQQVYFVVRTREADGPGRLIGFAQLEWINWLHGTARLKLGIGAAADRCQGYGSEALRLVLNYAFGELALHHVAAVTYEYSPRAARWLERHGFQLEVRQRRAVERDLRRWDTLFYGLLRTEWQPANTAGGPANTAGAEKE